MKGRRANVMASRKRRKAASKKTQTIKKNFVSNGHKVSITGRRTNRVSRDGVIITTTTQTVRRKPTPAELNKKRLNKNKKRK